MKKKLEKVVAVEAVALVGNLVVEEDAAPVEKVEPKKAAASNKPTPLAVVETAPVEEVEPDKHPDELAIEGQLSSVVGNMIIIGPMGEIEARNKTESIKANITEAAENLLQIKEREGWRALGYESWKEYVTHEYSFQQSHIFRLLSFGEITRNLSPIGESGYPMPATESVVRSMTSLPPEKQVEVWKEAVDTAPAGKVTAEHVKSIVTGKPAPSKPLRYHCKYHRCPVVFKAHVFSVSVDTMVCDRCGARHVEAENGGRLAPGEEARLDAALREKMDAANKKEAAIMDAGPIMALEFLGSANMYTPWRCEHCSVMQPAGSRYTVVQLEKEQRRVCDACLGLFQVPEKPDEFTCPRCRQRQVKVNGHVVCLNELCQAKWDNRIEYAEELEQAEMDLQTLRADLKTEAMQIIQRMPPEKLNEFAAVLEAWRS